MQNTNRNQVRRVVGTAIVVAVLGATAACTGSSSGSSNTGTTGSATASGNPATSGAATTSSNTPTAASGTTSASANGSGSVSSPHAVNGIPACTGTQLKVTLGQAGAATGHAGQPLVFTNTSSQTCSMQGYPGAAIMNGSTIVLNATRILNGFIGDERHLNAVPLVTLAPGAKAAAMLEYVVDNGETCYPSGTGTLSVTPPNTDVTTALGKLTAGPDGVCADFEIHPVVAGTLS